MFTKTFSLRSVVLLVALIAFAFSFAPQATAQSYATVHGMISDPTGAVTSNPTDRLGSHEIRRWRF